MSSARKKQFRVLLLFVLFPLWGIGALQLLVKSILQVHDICGTNFFEAKTSFDQIIYLLFSSAGFFAGMYFLVDTIRQYFQDKLAVWKVNREIEEKLRLSSAPTYDDGDGQFSYTKVWYMSFQNHLSSQSGYDTLQMKPLKRWPALLKNNFPEDLVPVWLIPLLLMSVMAVPVVALLVAATNVVCYALTGVWFCEQCLNTTIGLAHPLADAIWNAPVLCSAALCMALLSCPLRKAWHNKSN